KFGTKQLPKPQGAAAPAPLGAFPPSALGASTIVANTPTTAHSNSAFFITVSPLLMSTPPHTVPGFLQPGGSAPLGLLPHPRYSSSASEQSFVASAASGTV